MFRKLLIVLGIAVVLALSVITALGDNIRAFFGMSTICPAGQAIPPGWKSARWTNTQTDRDSTFGADLDTASYALGRRALEESRLPNPYSVRVEEYVNAFIYSYPQPSEGPFAVHLEGAPSPFTPGRYVLKVGLQGRHASKRERKPAHLVFLVDVSGTMRWMDKLPLAQEALRILVNNLDARDTVALITYAGEVRDVLPPTPAGQRETIIEAIDRLKTSAAEGSGFEAAYRHAVRTVSLESVSRIIVLTDGDDAAETMLDAVPGYVADGVTLTVVGFGMRDHRDDLLENLANKVNGLLEELVNESNGQLLYVDRYAKAKRLFHDGLTSTFEVIAKDVEVQVVLDPRAVTGYRLLGYAPWFQLSPTRDRASVTGYCSLGHENQAIFDAQYGDDKVDAGEIGAGHSVTALYEVELAPGAALENLAMVRVHSKSPPGWGASVKEFSFARSVLSQDLAKASADLRFAVALAGAADIFRFLPYAPEAKNFSLSTALELAAGATEGRPKREEAVTLLRRAKELLLAADARTWSTDG